MTLNDTEKALLVELSRNPVWAGLMRKVSTETQQVPKWKKGGDEAAKHHAWIFSSGFVECRDYMLKLLGYNDD